MKVNVLIAGVVRSVRVEVDQRHVIVREIFLDVFEKIGLVAHAVDHGVEAGFITESRIGTDGAVAGAGDGDLVNLGRGFRRRCFGGNGNLGRFRAVGVGVVARCVLVSDGSGLKAGRG